MQWEMLRDDHIYHLVIRHVYLPQLIQTPARTAAAILPTYLGGYWNFVMQQFACRSQISMPKTTYLLKTLFAE